MTDAECECVSNVSASVVLLLLQMFLTYLLTTQGSYKKLNLKFKNIQEHFWGGNKFVQEHFRRVIRTFYLQYYQQSHFVP